MLFLRELPHLSHLLSFLFSLYFANVTRFHFNTWLAIHQITKPSTGWLQYKGGPSRGTCLYSGSLIIIQAPEEQKDYSKKHIQNADLLHNDSKSPTYMQMWYLAATAFSLQRDRTSSKKTRRTINSKHFKRFQPLQKLPILIFVLI